MRKGGPNDRQPRAAAFDEALRRAQFAIQNQRLGEAEELAASILAANPGHLEATKIFGYALVLQGRAKDAIAPLEKLARASRDPESETQLAVALRQAGRGEDALVWLNRAIRRMPPFPAAYHELGFVLASLRRYAEAIDILKQGAVIAPMAVELILQLGFVYSSINDHGNALNCFARAYAVNPGHRDAIYAFGTALMRQRDYAQAAELFRRSLEADPGNTASRIGLGDCLINLGQADVGYACLRAATARGPKFFGTALKVSVASGHGRFWLRPSAAAKFFRGEKA
jgi:tetratricopeptide (TPR) repeat protein